MAAIFSDIAHDIVRPVMSVFRTVFQAKVLLNKNSIYNQSHYTKKRIKKQIICFMDHNMLLYV